jgi:outer membrane lipopolysaccharide assembly protein LptE/RlpB
VTRRPPAARAAGCPSPTRLLAVALLVGALAAGGCGYGLVGKTSSLPDNIRIVQFTTLENMTQRVQLEQRFSGEIARELASRGRFKVQSDSALADAALTGAVLAFNLFPVAFDAQGRATDYQVQVTARVSLKTLPDGKILWENPAYTFRDNYSYAATAASYVDLENDAIERVAGRFAQALVTSLLEGF